MRIGDWSSDVCSSDLFAALCASLTSNSIDCSLRFPCFEELRRRAAQMSFGEVEDKNMHARKPLFTASGFKHPTSPTEIDYAPERPIPQKMVQRTFDRWKIGRASCRERVCQSV